MGGHGYAVAKGRESTLRRILKENYKFVIGLVTDNTDIPEGAYELFKELNEKEIREYAAEQAKFYNFKLKKINVYSLENKTLKELDP